MISIARTNKPVILRSEDEISSIAPQSTIPDTQTLPPGKTLLESNIVVRVLNINQSSNWVEVEDGTGHRGYVDKNDIIAAEQNPPIPWQWWLDSLFYGLIFGYAPFMFGRVVDMFYFPIIDTTWPAWMPFVGGNHFLSRERNPLRCFVGLNPAPTWCAFG